MALEKPGKLGIFFSYFVATLSSSNYVINLYHLSRHFCRLILDFLYRLFIYRLFTYRFTVFYSVFFVNCRSPFIHLISVTTTVIVCIQRPASALTSESSDNAVSDQLNRTVDSVNQDIDYRSSAFSAAHNAGRLHLLHCHSCF